MKQISRHVSVENERPTNIETVNFSARRNTIYVNVLFKSHQIVFRDSGVLLKSREVSSIKNIVNNKLTIDDNKTCALFLDPVDFKLVGIYKMTNVVNDIHSKVMIIPMQIYFVPIKLLRNV